MSHGDQSLVLVLDFLKILEATARFPGAERRLSQSQRDSRWQRSNALGEGR